MNKNKKIIVLFVSTIVFFFGFAGCTVNTTYSKGEAFRKKFAMTKEDLPEVSDLIVIATVLPEKTQHLSTFELGGQEYTGGGYTFTRLEIKKVLKGEPEADEITITEEYYTLDKKGIQIITDGSYLPTKE